MLWDWSPDGRFLLCADSTFEHLLTLPLENGAPPAAAGDSSGGRGFRLSPDGKLVAYGSYGTSQPQIFIATFPSFSEKRQVSKSGGIDAMWGKDGRELYFQGLDGFLRSVDIKAGAKIEAGFPPPCSGCLG